MNYPESIYNRYEIIEKDIYGQKHYCLVRIYSIFGITIRRKVKIYEFVSWAGCCGLKSWWKDREFLEQVIKSSYESAETRFREKVTK